MRSSFACWNIHIVGSLSSSDTSLLQAISMSARTLFSLHHSQQISTRSWLHFFWNRPLSGLLNANNWQWSATSESIATCTFKRKQILNKCHLLRLHLYSIIYQGCEPPPPPPPLFISLAVWEYKLQVALNNNGNVLRNL